MDIPEELVVRDAKGMPRIILSAQEHLPSIIIVGNDRSELIMEMDGNSSRIKFRRSDGVDAAVIASSTASVSVVVFDRSAKPICTLAIDTDARSGSISAFDASGNVATLQKRSFK